MGHRGGGGGHCHRLPRTLENCLSSTSPLILLLLVILLNWTNAAYALGRVSWGTGWPVKSANKFFWLTFNSKCFLGQLRIWQSWCNSVTLPNQSPGHLVEVARSLPPVCPGEAETIALLYVGVLLQYQNTTLKYPAILRVGKRFFWRIRIEQLLIADFNLYHVSVRGPSFNPVEVIA